MRLPPLFKFGPRARATSWGIALCTMFIVAGFSVVNGLGESMDTLRANFDVEYHLLTIDGGSSPAFFSETDVGSLGSKMAFCVYAEAVATPGDLEVQLLAVVDSAGVLPEIFTVNGNDLLGGPEFPLAGSFSLADTEVTVVGSFSSSIFSPAWALGSTTLLGKVTGQPGMWNLAIGHGLASSEIDELEAVGFSVTEMIGVIEFLDSGMSEIEADANWILLPSAFVIAVLAYSFISMETSDRTHDIGILKTVGAGRRNILGYLMLNAIIVSTYAALLGLALGIVLSYGLSTLASTIFTAVFVIHASEGVLAIAFLTTLGAGFAGALVPSARVTLTTPVHDLKEVERSY